MKNLFKSVGKKLVRFSVNKLGVGRYEIERMLPIPEPFPVKEETIFPVHLCFIYDDPEGRVDPEWCKRKIMLSLIDNPDFQDCVAWQVEEFMESGKCYVAELKVLPKTVFRK